MSVETPDPATSKASPAATSSDQEHVNPQWVRLLNVLQMNVRYTHCPGAELHAEDGRRFLLKSGEIHFDLSTGRATGKVVVDSTSGESGNSSRDKKMQHDYLESQKFPEIVFAPAQVKGALSPSGTSQVEVSGIFNLHGADHDLMLTISVQPQAGTPQANDQLRATTKFTIPYVQWGIQNPSTFILRVSDKVDIEIHAVGKLAPTASAQ